VTSKQPSCFIERPILVGTGPRVLLRAELEANGCPPAWLAELEPSIVDDGVTLDGASLEVLRWCVAHPGLALLAHEDWPREQAAREATAGALRERRAAA
jgi:hypothetical protein